MPSLYFNLIKSFPFGHAGKKNRKSVETSAYQCGSLVHSATTERGYVARGQAREMRHASSSAWGSREHICCRLQKRALHDSVCTADHCPPLHCHEGEKRTAPKILCAVALHLDRRFSFSWSLAPRQARRALQSKMLLSQCLNLRCSWRRKRIFAVRAQILDIERR